MSDLMIAEKSPVEIITREQIIPAVERMRAIVPDSSKMTTAQLTIIAQESILYRTMPGVDVHYFVDKDGNLKRVEDYKYLKNWALRKERALTGNQAASVEDDYQDLSEQDKVREGLKDADVAVYCTLTTDADRRRLRREVAAWLEMGFEPEKALALARETLGLIGTRAIGVVLASDFNIPKGWSRRQKAKKLSLKNAINMRYGHPTVDEAQQLARQMTRIETKDDDWSNVPLDEPMEIQAKFAEIEALAREVKAGAEEMTPEQQAARLKHNTEIMRGPEDEAIGEEPVVKFDPDFFDFAIRVCEHITFYADVEYVADAAEKLGLIYDPENEEMLFDALAEFAGKQADADASGKPEQDTFAGEPAPNEAE